MKIVLAQTGELLRRYYWRCTESKTSGSGLGRDLAVGPPWSEVGTPDKTA